MRSQGACAVTATYDMAFSLYFHVPHASQVVNPSCLQLSFNVADGVAADVAKRIKLSMSIGGPSAEMDHTVAPVSTEVPC